MCMISCRPIFLFLLLCVPASFPQSIAQHKVQLVGSSDNNDNNTVSKKYCGHFIVSNNGSFDIFDREVHNQKLEAVVKSNAQKKFKSINVKSGCEVIFCAPDLLNSTKQIRFCDTFTSNHVNNTSATDSDSDDEAKVDISAYKYFHADSASCSCKVPTIGCNQSTCEHYADKVFDPPPGKEAEGEEDEAAIICAAFYKDINCSTCRYDKPFKIKINESFSPINNSFIVNSMIVKKHCVLEIDSYGIPKAYYKGGYYNLIQLAYVQKVDPAKFLCTCYNSSTEGSSVPVISIVSATMVVLFILLLGSVAIGIKYYLIRRKLLKFSEEAIKKFMTETEANTSEDYGVQNDSCIAGDEFHDSQTHYISMNYVAIANTPPEPYFRKFEIPRLNLTILDKKLGNGHFGCVCLGKLLQPRENEEIIIDVAVKIAKRSTNILYFVTLLDEIKILAYIGSHPFIVSILGTCTENVKQRDALLILEMCDQGCVKNYLEKNWQEMVELDKTDQSVLCKLNKTSTSSTGPYLKWSSVENVCKLKLKHQAHILLLKWSSQIANGMNFLHSKCVVHIDLAIRNILLTEDLTAKISDFGLSRRILPGNHQVKLPDEYGLPVNWIAPESLHDRTFTFKSDIWTFGILLWELFTLGQEPYKEFHMNYIQLEKFLIDGKRLGKPAHASDEIYQQISNCWAFEPIARPNFDKLEQFFYNKLNMT